MLSFKRTLLGALKTQLKLNLSANRYVSSKKFLKVEEVVHTINPYANIKVNCANTKFTIKPYDLLECQDANYLKASLYSSNNEQQLLNKKIFFKFPDATDEDILITDQNVDENFTYECVLEVPVKSNFEIKSKQEVEISNMYSEFVKIISEKSLQVKNLCCTSIDLASINGSITCDGIILAHKLDIHTENKGEVNLDKLQGDLMHCKTIDGNINVNSCYIEHTKFATETGTLNLRNVHKKSEIFVLKQGFVDMSGIHGNIYLKSNGGDINLQFSEIIEECVVMCNDSKNVNINIADEERKDRFLEIHSDKIILEDKLKHLSQILESENYLRYGDENSENKLLICTKGNLTLGKMSWADNLKLKLNNKDN